MPPIGLKNTVYSVYEYSPRFDVGLSISKFYAGKHKDSFNWVTACRYVGIYTLSSREFKSALTEVKSRILVHSKQKFRKIGRLVVKRVVMKLNAYLFCCTAWIPILLIQVKNVDFILTRSSMKLFQTSVIDINNECYDLFNLKLASVSLL